MKRLALLLMLLASPAHAVATHKYVTTTGAGGHTGDDLANAYSLAEANAAAAPTFVFHLSDGTYATGIAPAASGDSLTDEACVYIGNMTTPSAVTVASITLAGDNFVTLRSLRSNGVVSVTSGYRDSLHDVSGTGSGVGSTTASLVTDHLIRSYINGGTWTRGTGTRHSTASDNTYCYFSNMTITHSYSGTGIDETRAWLMDGGVTDSCYFVGIKQTVTVPANTTFDNEAAWRFFYNIRDSYFIDCRLTVDDDQSSGFALGLRGTTALHKNVYYVRDTILDVGDSRGARVAVSGNEPINDINWVDCVYYLGGKWHVNEGSGRWSWTGCVLVSGNLGCEENTCGAYMFEGPEGSGSLTFDHCSIYYRRNGSSRPPVDGGTSEGIFAISNLDMTTVSVTNSVVAVRQTNTPVSCRHQRVISMGNGGAAGRFDYNVYYRYGGSPDSTYAVNRDAESCSRVGPLPNTGTSCQSWFQNCHSRWAGPNASYVFTDTTWNPGSITGPKPDLRPLPGGLIIHSTLWPDGYVGAYGPVTETVPAAMDSLRALPQYFSALGRQALVLTWIPPCDYFEGHTDTALFIRMYNKPYTLVPGGTTAAWWDSARVFGDYPFMYREGFHEGYIMVSPYDSIGWHNSREVGGDPVSIYDGNADGAVNLTDLWFGARYQVNSGPLSPIRFAYADLDSQITVRQSATPPPGGINVGAASPTGTYFWWYKPNDVTSYDVRYISSQLPSIAPGAVLISEETWSAAVRVFTTPSIANDSVQPPGTIHYVRVAAPCGPPFYSIGVKFSNALWTSGLGNPVVFTCPGGGF